MNGNVPRGTLCEGVDMFHVEHLGKDDKKKGNVPRGTLMLITKKNINDVPRGTLVKTIDLNSYI